jgi:hypothetical protein
MKQLKMHRALTNKIFPGKKLSRYIISALPRPLRFLSSRTSGTPNLPIGLGA